MVYICNCKRETNQPAEKLKKMTKEESNHLVKKAWTHFSTEVPQHYPHRNYYDGEIVSEDATTLAYYREDLDIVIVLKFSPICKDRTEFRRILDQLGPPPGI